ncbi:MAG: hypothetical protein UR95_C0003G0059 [Parcubacteria group bacterium GW2011_GWC1_36_108]|nr:MAG: hypothetical protein UR95_C0003G0059 [Parcubacteria group bacterium GW2011_GWC1_36_108]
MEKILLCPDCLDNDERKIIGCEDSGRKKECLWCSAKDKANCPQHKTPLIFFANPGLRCDPCDEIRNIW